MPNGELMTKYQEWLGTPEQFRHSDWNTRAKFAAKFRIDEDTLILWEGQPHFWDGVFSRARAILGTEMASIMEALLGRAQDGSVQAIKLCLELLGVYAEQLEVKQSFDDDQLVMIYGSNVSIPALPKTKEPKND